MKFKIAAGAEADILSEKELRGALKDLQTSWMSEVSRGDRWRRFSAYGDSDGAGLVTIGDGLSQYLGPEAGMVWSVTRLAVTNYDPVAPATNRLNLSVNSTESSDLIRPGIPTFSSFSPGIVLMGGDRLYVSGTAAVSSRVWVTGQARELPVSLLWRLS